MGLNIIHHVKDKKLDSERKIGYFLSHEESRGNSSVEGRLHGRGEDEGRRDGVSDGHRCCGIFRSHSDTHSQDYR